MNTQPLGNLPGPPVSQEARTYGVSLAVIGGLAAVVASAWVSHNPGYFWAFILVAIMIGGLGINTIGHPVVIGLIACVACLILAAFIVILHFPDLVWGVLLVSFITRAVVSQIEDPKVESEKE